MQIIPFVAKHKNTIISKYYENIYGIEKEDRLAKVAKVSACMYGQENINILDKDALATIKEIKNDSFDILVANPPFAVEDFLLTLEDEDREKYELFNPNLSLGTNNIQCFFLERAKHLLAPNGIAAIIIPVTILSNSIDTLFIQTREVLLKYFDIVAITDFTTNYKIFGQTGTKTLVLFLRRKAQRPEPAAHFEERVQSWFDTDWDNTENDTEIKYFDDIEYIQKYCEHIEIPFDEFKNLLNFTKIIDYKILALLKEFEIFKEYWNDFEKSQEYRKINDRFSKQLTDLEKNLYIECSKQKKVSKQKFDEKELKDEIKILLPQKRKELEEKLTIEIEKSFWQMVIKIEKEKVYYFSLAYTNPQKVLIVKIPTDNEETKQFIGYEWSGAKGFEGITYKGGETVNDITTPLFDPNDRYNPEKINYYIQENFNCNKNLEIPESLQKYISYAKLTDMLDFNQKSFNKVISLNIKKNFVFETQWTLYKLENLCEICRGASPRPIEKFITENQNGINWIKIGDVKEGEKYITQTAQKITLEGAEKSRPVQIGDFILSNSMSFGRPYILKISGCIHDGWLLMTKFSNDLNKDYLYEILSYKDVQQQFSDSASGAVVQNLNTDRVKNTKIPLPPKEIQDNIVSECKKIDIEFEKSKTILKNHIIERQEKLKIEFSNGHSTMKLGDVAEFKRGPFGGSLKKEIFVNEGYKIYEQQHAINNNFEIGYYYITKDKYEEMKGFALESGDLIMSCSGTIGKVAIFPDNAKEGIINQALLRFRPKKEIISSAFLKLFIENSTDLFYENSHGAGLKNIASVQILKTLKIPVPSIAEQKQLVKEFEKITQQINDYREIVENIPNKKELIMKKYL
jgi:type I restriction enzyme M protein